MRVADATILVVDDEPALLEIFSTWLKRQGATVLQASNGVEALQILSEHAVDALVSDMRMPVMDGVSLVRGIHELNLSIHTIIFVSGFNDVSLRLLYSLGVKAMLPKPLSRRQLLDALESSFRNRDELWLYPLPAPPQETISLPFHSLNDAIAEQQFNFGRGGCCVLSQQPLPEGPVRLEFHFTGDSVSLTGQGVVRWYDGAAKRAGIEFNYLDAACRGWVLDRIQALGVQAYIPSC